MDGSGQPADIPWGQEDLELMEFHRYLAGIRNWNRAFRTGSFKPLLAAVSYTHLDVYKRQEYDGGWYLVGVETDILDGLVVRI